MCVCISTPVGVRCGYTDAIVCTTYFILSVERERGKSMSLYLLCPPTPPKKEIDRCIEVKELREGTSTV